MPRLSINKDVSWQGPNNKINNLHDSAIRITYRDHHLTLSDYIKIPLP